MSRFHLGVFHSFIFFPVYIINFINCLQTSLGFKFRSIRQLKSGSNTECPVSNSTKKILNISTVPRPNELIFLPLINDYRQFTFVQELLFQIVQKQLEITSTKTCDFSQAINNCNCSFVNKFLLFMIETVRVH